MPYIGKEPEHGNYQLLDALTAPSGVFDGSRTVFNLTADGVAVYPTSPTTMIISLGGVLQEPNSSYTVSGNQITFTTAPATSTTFFGVSLGDTLDIGTPSDGSVTVAKMAANSVDSDQYVDGSIDLAHMSVNSIDSDQYVDGSIDSAHIGNDQIDSQHYAAQSIDNEHLADDAVGADELAANAVVNASVASGAAIEFSKMADLTASRALVSDGNGDVSVSAVTSTEIGYLDGVTSAIQTQIDGAGGIASVVADTSPQLGGNLDMQANLLVGNGGSTGIAISANGEVTMSAQPLVLVHSASTQTNATGNSTKATVVFGATPIQDRNSDFDGTSTFTAPVTGTYLVTTSLYIMGLVNTANTCNVFITSTNREFNLPSGSPDAIKTAANELSYSATAIVPLEAGDTVLIKLTVGGGTAVVDIADGLLTRLGVHLIA